MNKYDRAGFVLIRRSSGLIEAKCEHGVGHPIARSIELMNKHGPEGSKGTWGVHGCDGCCSKLTQIEEKENA